MNTRYKLLRAIPITLEEAKKTNAVARMRKTPVQRLPVTLEKKKQRSIAAPSRRSRDKIVQFIFFCRVMRVQLEFGRGPVAGLVRKQ